MKKMFLSLLMIAALGTMTNRASAQMKVGVFDIDYMVQAMPGYGAVDSLMQIYQRDSINTEYQILNSEYQRLDSTYKADSLAKKSAAILKYSKDQIQPIGLKLVYWQQYAQQKTQAKTQELSQPLYEQVVDAYKKFLALHKYAIILKPQTYEQGFQFDNLFVGVAKQLKLTSLPQELIYLGGDDPDPAKPAAGAAGAATRPAAGAGTTRPATTPKKP